MTTLGAWLVCVLLAACVGGERRAASEVGVGDVETGADGGVEVTSPETISEVSPDSTPGEVDSRETDDTIVDLDVVDIEADGEVAPPPRCDPPCAQGVCLADGVCDCVPGFIGPACDERAVCEPACENGGVCVAHDTCDCSLTGFGGATCGARACNGVVCPELTGFAVDCNAASHCEYVRTHQSEAWHADDVWIYVPPGEFMMGSGSDLGRDDERPQHLVAIERGYLVGKLELTVRVFEACGASDACTGVGVATGVGDNGVNRSGNGRERHPQNGLRFDQAEAACAFLGSRLPSEAEWERAANGAGEHRLYPWGNGPAPECGVHAVFDDDGIGCGTGGTFEVGAGRRTSGASAVGALDMVGNVDEWVDDCWHDTYKDAPVDGSAWTTACASATQVTRGESYAYPDYEIRTAARNYREATTANTLAGVRCVRDVEAGGGP